MAERFAEGTVTILFTDVEGSTDLGRVAGDHSARRSMSKHDDLIRAHVQDHGGREVKALGDGFMIAFPSARRAVACAVAIQKAFLTAARADPESDLPIRMGLNTGEAITEGDDLFGAAVSAAARISGHAKGRQILVSEVVKSLVGNLPDVEFRDAGAKELKGFDEPWRLFEVAWRDESAVGSRKRTAFVGREDERARLSRFLDGVGSSSGSIVLVGGEPGVGKTRLAEEVLSQAERRGFRTLTGRCYDLDSPAPYLPFIELLEAAAREVDRETFRLALGDAAGEIAKVMPQLRQLFDDIPDGLDLPLEQERRYLFNSIAEFVERAASVRPLVLFLDDIHWADESSLLLAQSLAARIEHWPVLIIGTYRDVELDVNRPLSTVLEDLLRRRLAHRITLRRFSEEGVRVFLTRLGGAPPPEPLVKTIFAETDGNAFFVEEVFRHLQEEGRLFEPDGTWRSQIDLAEVEVPESLRLVIGRRLEKLDDGSRRALTAAAVIGRTFDFELLEAITDLDEETLLDAIETAERLDLIQPLSLSPVETRYEIVHELIRQTLLSGVSAPRRQRLHLKVADEMERAAGEKADERAAEILNHLYRSGSAASERTVRYLLLAGERAQASAAFEDAQRFFEEALEAGGADEMSRARALVGLGRAKLSRGSRAEAIEHWNEALTMYESVGERESLVGLASEIGLQLGWAGRWMDVIAVAARVLHQVGEQPTPERARLLALAGVGMSWADQYDSAQPLFDEATQIADHLGDEQLIGEVMGFKGAHEYAYGLMSSTIASCRRAMDLVRGRSSTLNYASAVAFLAFSYAALGLPDDAEPCIAELEELSNRLGFAGGQMFVLRARMISSREMNETPEAALSAAHQDLALCERNDLPWVGQSHTFISRALFLKGDIDGALEHARQSVELDLPGALYGFGLGNYTLQLAYAGRGDEAVQLWNANRSQLPVSGALNSIGRWSFLAYVVEASFVLGRDDDLAELRPLFEEVLNTEQTYRFDGRLIRGLLGLSAAASKDWAQMEAHFDAAIETSDRLPYFVEVADVRRLYASALLRRREAADIPRIRELLGTALDLYDKREMSFHSGMTHRLLEEVGS